MHRLDQATIQQVHDWLVGWAEQVRAQAKRNAPMRTGYLKSTVYAEVSEWFAQVGADAAYACFVEFGTRFMAAQPYLYPAIQEFLPELEMNIVGAIEQAKRQAGLSTGEAGL